MANLIVTYDPIYGQTVPDGSAEEWVQKNIIWPTTLSNQETDGTVNVTVGSFLLIDFVRLAMHRKKLWEPVQFAFKNKNGMYHFLTPNSDGRLEDWPEGFCDTYDKVLDELLDI
jgi:hypothetical protein